MSSINLKLKTYDELTFEISQLNIDKYLLEQKLQQKENIIKEVRKTLINSKEYKMAKEMNLTSKMSVLIELLQILDKGSEKE